MEYTLAKPQFGGVNFAAATFTPVLFNPKQADISLLAHSIDKLEQRREKAETQKLAVAEAFSKARQLLPDNEETNQYITNEQNKAMSDIDSLVSMGDYSNALTRSRQLARDFISSPEYNARIKEHEQRQEWNKKLDASNVDQYIKDYYKKVYRDKNNFTRDDKGNITGTFGWEAPLPEKSVGADEIIRQAIVTTKQEIVDKASTWGTSNNFIAKGGHNSYKKEVLTADKLAKTARAIVLNNDSYRRSFEDQRLAGISKIKELEEQLGSAKDDNERNQINSELDSYKSRFYKNGAPLTTTEYIDKTFSSDNDMIRNASYEYEHTNKGSESSTGSPGGNVNADFAGYTGFEANDFTGNGPGVRIVTKQSERSAPAIGRRPMGQSRFTNRPQQSNTPSSSGSMFGNKISIGAKVPTI